MGFGGDSRGPSNSSPSGEAEFQAAAVFDLISSALKENGKALVKKAGGVFQFDVTKGPGGKEDSWIVDAKNGTGSVTRGGKAPSDVTITMTDADLVSLLNGKLNAQKAFFQGLLKIKGNMGLAMKLEDFLKEAQKMSPKL